jgi:hypothetical protein
MAKDKIRRYKHADELDVGEMIEAKAAVSRGAEPPRFERDEYGKGRAAALAASGLEGDDDSPPPIEQMTVAEHVKRKQETQR